jgi:PhnB protein
VTIHLYVENGDEVFPRALAAGATALRPVADQFYGDRLGTLRDPFGHVWNVAPHEEDLSAEEMHRRAQAMKQAGAA